MQIRIYIQIKYSIRGLMQLNPENNQWCWNIWLNAILLQIATNENVAKRRVFILMYSFK